MRLAGVVVDLCRDEAAVFLVLFVGRDEGLLDRLHHHLARHAFFGSELGDGSHEFTFHAGMPSALSTSGTVSARGPYNKRSGGYPLRCEGPATAPSGRAEPSISQPPGLFHTSGGRSCHLPWLRMRSTRRESASASGTAFSTTSLPTYRLTWPGDPPT